MKLEAMSIEAIFVSYDFSDSFIQQFREWCSKQTPVVESFEMSSLIYAPNPMLRMLSKEEE